MIDEGIKIISIETVISYSENYYMVQCVLNDIEYKITKIECLYINYDTNPYITRMIINAKGFYWLYKALKDAGYLEKFLAPLPDEEKLSTKLLFEIGEL